MNHLRNVFVHMFCVKAFDFALLANHAPNRKEMQSSSWMGAALDFDTLKDVII